MQALRCFIVACLTLCPGAFSAKFRGSSANNTLAPGGNASRHEGVARNTNASALKGNHSGKNYTNKLGPPWHVEGELLEQRIGSGGSTPNASQKIKVEFFYEALCPFCQAFFEKSLTPAWEDEELRSRLELFLYPYGNAQTLQKEMVSDGYRYWHEELGQEGFDYVFPCQHGPDECFGNMLEACSIQHLRESTKWLPFIACMESEENSSVEKSSYECAQRQGIDLDPIKACTKSPEGNHLMAGLGEATNALQKPAGPKEYVPWVVLNGYHCSACETDSEANNSGNFLNELCFLLAPPKPQVCNNVKVQRAGSPSQSSTTLVLLTVALTVFSFQ